MNVAEHVSRFASRDPERSALVSAGDTWTYGDLLSAVVEQEALLGSDRMRVGARIAILLPNSVTFVAVYLACLRLGCIAVPVDPRLTADEIRHVLDDSAAEAVVVLDELTDKLPTGATRPRVILHERVPSRAGRPWLDRSPPRDLEPAHPAALLYTSGTTGRPKGALLSHDNVAFVMKAKVRYLELRPDDVLLLFLPLHHCFGLNAILNPGLEAGATIVLAEGFDRNRILGLVNDHGVTRFFAVPQIFRLLLDSGITPEAIPTVQYALSAGDRLPEDVQQTWLQRMGWPIHQAYGLTETSPFATYNHAAGPRPGSAGTAIDGVEIEVRRGSGEPARRGEVGEVWIHGPNVMLGYWNAPEATAETIVDGWLRTADLGQVDDDGFLYLTGRATDVIIVRGQNVYAAEVERVLLADERVADAVVYGVPHEITGEIVCASVVPADGAVTARDLRASCARVLAAHKVPVRVDLVSSIPAGATGKSDRRALAARIRARWDGQPLGEGAP